MLLESINKNFYNLKIQFAIENFPYKTMLALVQYGRSLGYKFSGDWLEEKDDYNKSSNFFFKSLKDKLTYNKNFWKDRISLIFVKDNLAKTINIVFDDRIGFQIRISIYDIDLKESQNNIDFNIKNNATLNEFFNKIFYQDKSEKDSNNINFLFKRLHLTFKNNFFKLYEKDSEITFIYNHGSNNDKNRRKLKLVFGEKSIEGVNVSNLSSYDFFNNYEKIILIVEKHSNFIMQEIINYERSATHAIHFIEAEKNEKVMQSHKTIEELRDDSLNNFKESLKDLMRFSEIQQLTILDVFDEMV